MSKTDWHEANYCRECYKELTFEERYYTQMCGNCGDKRYIVKTRRWRRSSWILFWLGYWEFKD